MCIYPIFMLNSINNEFIDDFVIDLYFDPGNEMGNYKVNKIKAALAA